ncbi:MAG: hypothetical protein HYU86_09820 [Chloroflexi bacterium]|nr:hypothetical protein [Chloroflexota bacterium]
MFEGRVLQRKHLIWLGLVTGLFFLAYLFYQIDLRALAGIFSGANFLSSLPILCH